MYRAFKLEYMPRKSDIDAKLLKTLTRVSDNLERLRKEKDWSQVTAAEKLDLDVRYYQRLESGKYSFGFATLTKIAHVFKVDISEFFKQ